MQKLHNKVVVVYNKYTLEIITIVKPNNTPLNIKSFIDSQIKYNPKCNGLSCNDISFIISDRVRYDKYESFENTDFEYFINPLTQDLDVKLFKKRRQSNRDLQYDQAYKRDFTFDQVYDMYHNDYIGFNLKNIIQKGGFKAEFVPISKLNIRTHITMKSWNYFIGDPYLKESADDKLKLGRSIIEMGTWWPFVVSYLENNNNDLYVCEGNHRITSLKLLSMYGEIPKDFKVLCLYIPFNWDDYKYTQMYKELETPVKSRYVIEKSYGCDILADDHLMNIAKSDILSRDGKFINEYTVEEYATTLGELMGGIHSYPIFLRDLFYIYDSKIKPSKIINDENAFKEWIKQ